MDRPRSSRAEREVWDIREGFLESRKVEFHVPCDSRCGGPVSQCKGQLKFTAQLIHP